MQGNQFVGSIWDWVNFFAAAMALGLVCGYVLLGATWLILKTEDEVQQDSYRYAKLGAWSLLIVAVALVMWFSQKYPFLSQKCFFVGRRPC